MKELEKEEEKRLEEKWEKEWEKELEEKWEKEFEDEQEKKENSTRSQFLDFVW